MIIAYDNIVYDNATLRMTSFLRQRLWGLGGKLQDSTLRMTSFYTSDVDSVEEDQGEEEEQPLND